MAFALTKFSSYGVNIVGPSYKRGTQKALLTITALVTDVSLDLANDSGTFWTAALANATYGSVATKALSVLDKIDTVASALLGVKSQQLLPRLQAAAAAGTSYTLAVSGVRPNITCAAGQGELSWQIELEWSLNDFIFPIVSSFG
jgi:hypothetical protein